MVYQGIVVWESNVKTAVLLTTEDRFFLSHRRPVAEALRDRGFVVHVAAADTGHSQRVRDALPPAQKSQLRTLGPMYLRGKSEATEVFRVEWQSGHDADETVMGVSMFKAGHASKIELSARGQTLRLEPQGEKLTVGRATTASLSINDARVSRVHATLEWRGGQFVLNDNSSFGTWVYLGNQSEPVILRRTECYLVGQGQITLGCEREAESPPVVAFSVKTR